MTQLLAPVSASWALDTLMACLSGNWVLNKGLNFEVLPQAKLPISRDFMQVLLFRTLLLVVPWEFCSPNVSSMHAL